MRMTSIGLILAALNAATAYAKPLLQPEIVDMPDPSTVINGKCDVHYIDLEVDATAAGLRERRQSAKEAGASKFTDYVFVLDGVRYEMSFQQLKHALKTEQHRRHFGAHKPAMRTGDAS
ncbi:hypothetical protein [Burkholderia anthina]|uniref:hypothetical protein n=1 Tax=Burkholderia anthina TaxID=179879 RepID=UPI001588F0E9|nr:hypothetical protein [Burkholderia anthina]